MQKVSMLKRKRKRMHNRERRYQTYFFLFVLVLLQFSCKPSVPSKYIQPDDMEDILYDYHLADGMSNQNGDYRSLIMYKTAILKKYNVSNADFDSSMVYYARHTEELHKIYEHLAERIGAEAVSLGATANDINKYGMISSKGDTADVWSEAKTAILSQYDSFNLKSYSIKADTAYHKGDRLVLNFDTQFIFQEGMRDGVAALAIVFSNDSVANQIVHMSSSNHYSVQVGDDNHLGIKEIKGFFLLNDGANSQLRSSTTLRIMILYNIRLIRIHESDDKAIKVNTDSIHKSDSVNMQRSSAARELDTPQMVIDGGNALSLKKQVNVRR